VSPPDDPPDEPWGAGAKELTLEDFLLTGLEIAKKDLARNCADGLLHLIEDCRYMPENAAKHVPREVVAFVRSFFKPGRDGRLYFKQPRGMASYDRTFLRWQNNPNRVAASLCEDMRGDGNKPRERLRLAVEYVNAQPYYLEIGKKADPDKVRELLRRGRGKRPVDPWENPENDWKN
jgi:hypothetical protein